MKDDQEIAGITGIGTGKIKFYEFPDSMTMDEGPYIVIEPLDIPTPTVFGDNQRLIYDSLLQVETWSKNRALTRETAEKVESILWDNGFRQVGGINEFDSGVFRDARRYRILSYSDDFILRELEAKDDLTIYIFSRSFFSSRLNKTMNLTAIASQETNVISLGNIGENIDLLISIQANTAATGAIGDYSRISISGESNSDSSLLADIERDRVANFITGSNSGIEASLKTVGQIDLSVLSNSLTNNRAAINFKKSLTGEILSLSSNRAEIEIRSFNNITADISAQSSSTAGIEIRSFNDLTGIISSDSNSRALFGVDNLSEMWASGENIELSAEGTMTKVSGGNAWNAGAKGASLYGLGENIAFVFTADTPKTIAFGLTESTAPDTYTNDITYKFELKDDLSYQIFNQGFLFWSGTYAVNDVFRVSSENGIIAFHINDVFIAQNTYTINYPVYLDASIYTQGESFTAKIDRPLSQPVIQVTNLYNSVRLDWEPVTNADSYTVFRSDVWGQLGTPIPGAENIVANTFTDTTVTGGGVYMYTVRAINETRTIDSVQDVGRPSAIVIYENRLVTFDGYPNYTVYDAEEVTADFGNYSTLNGGDRLKTDNAGRLRFDMPVGMFGSANIDGTGGIIKSAIVAKNEYNLEYEIRFDNLFPWSKGGKVPGLSGGVGYTGGEPAWNGDGFSVRLMWREEGRIIPYVYHTNQPDIYGDSFGTFDAGIGYFTYTKTHKVRIYVKLNTGANADGILRIYLDDVEIYAKTNIRYRTDASKIDTAHISIFAGGDDATWAMTGSSYIRLDNFRWY